MRERASTVSWQSAQTEDIGGLDGEGAGYTVEESVGVCQGNFL